MLMVLSNSNLSNSFSVVNVSYQSIIQSLCSDFVCNVAVTSRITAFLVFILADEKRRNECFQPCFELNKKLRAHVVLTVVEI